MSGVRRITAEGFEQQDLPAPSPCHTGEGRYPRRGWIPAFAGMTREVGSRPSLPVLCSMPEEAFEPVDVVVALAELGIVDEALMQGDRRFDPADHVFGQRPAQPH